MAKIKSELFYLFLAETNNTFSDSMLATFFKVLKPEGTYLKVIACVFCKFVPHNKLTIECFYRIFAFYLLFTEALSMRPNTAPACLQT